MYPKTAVESLHTGTRTTRDDIVREEVKTEASRLEGGKRVLSEKEGRSRTSVTLTNKWVGTGGGLLEFWENG